MKTPHRKADPGTVEHGSVAEKYYADKQFKRCMHTCVI